MIDTQVEKPSPQYLSQVFDKVNAIKLKTLDSFLISNVKQVIKTKDYIFIAEYNRILQFDTSGHLIRQIGSYGKGPGQHLIINRIAVNPTDNKIVIAGLRQLLCYSFSGDFIRSIRLSGVMTEYIYFINDQLWLYTKPVYFTSDKSTSGKFYIYNEQLQIVDSVFNYQVSNDWSCVKMGYPTYYYLSVLKSGTYMYIPVLCPESVLRDTVYEITGDRLKPVIKLDFSEILVTNENVIIDPKTMTPQEANEAMIKIRSVTIGNIYRTEKFLFSEYYHLDKPFFFCFNLSKQKGYNMSEGFTDDLYGTGKPVRLIPLDLQKGEFCFVKNGYEVEGIINGVNENSNPVIFFIRTKE